MTVQNLVILVAIVVALPTGYAVAELTGEAAAGFFVVVLVGVDVPLVYEEQWRPSYDAPRMAVTWTLVACILAVGTFLAGYRLGVAVTGAGALAAGASFLVTSLLTFAVGRYVGSGSGGGTSE